MKWVHTEFLYALPVLWLLAWGLWRLGEARRRQRLKVFTGGAASWAESGQVPGLKRLDAWLWLLVASALLLSLARPLLFQSDDRSELQGTPYLVALDASRSMLAADVKPSRYSAATNALDRFLQASKADRVGLITFSGIGYLNAPLTFDTVSLRTILGYVNPNALVDPGSSIASALDRAARFFTSNQIPQRTLIVISDGEELDGQAVALARKLFRDQKIHVHTVGVGTQSGARIPGARGGGVTNSMGLEVVTRLDENNLRRIANAAGGRYYALGTQEDGLRRLREEVLRPLAEEAARNDLANYREVYFVPLTVAALAWLARLLLGADRVVRPRALTPILTTESR